ncbi:MAG TPA: TIGR03564 family F420-dependent LLM class oxidoreductase [Acidimicrobiales bacterium]|nr:TIGR03564 family F420-dependent LLM class oxidoreductase [Acidimicrobiales bacterium]
MRIGTTFDLSKPLPDIVGQLRGYAELGLSVACAEQIFGYDVLTLFAAIGNDVPGIDLGTAVVPVYSRHPQAMAQQALTVQAATGNRLVLGIGLSHQIVVEGLWGYSYGHPARYMREYLSALVPMLHGEAVRVEGTMVTAITGSPLEIPDAAPPPVLVAALGQRMLRLAGEMADGTVTWMCGLRTVGSHIAPVITAAAEAAGRPAPRVGVGLPVVVTADREGTRAMIDEALAMYPTLPSYRAMLDIEGVDTASGVALVGSEEEVAGAVAAFADAGATELVASVMGTSDERRRTLALLGSLNA